VSAGVWFTVCLSTDWRLCSVEPSNGKPTPGKYTIRLSLKTDDVERPIGEPVSLRLSVDPRKLDFAVL
jgi:hypothetical protein